MEQLSQTEMFGAKMAGIDASNRGEGEHDGPEALPSAEAQPALDDETLAPMLRQYKELKRTYSEHLVLFQVGDFYEVFFDDALTVSSVLGIRLTSRDKNNPNPVPMCGVPIHAIENYLPRLINAGYSCVLYSQLEEEKRGKAPVKGGVRREISRVITPGVRFEGDGLDAKASNYLAACVIGSLTNALAYVDVSTGLFRVAEYELTDELVEAVERLQPAEVILPSTLFSVSVEKNTSVWKELKKRAENAHSIARPFPEISPGELRRRLEEKLTKCHQLKVAELSRETLSACEVVLRYIDEVSFGRSPKLSSFVVESSENTMVLDAATQRNLELCETRLTGERRNSLLERLDECRTAMGSREFADWILRPSNDASEIALRHDAVEALIARAEVLQSIREKLAGVRDIERLVARVTGLRANPRDLVSLKESLEPLPEICNGLASLGGELFKRHLADLDCLEDVFESLEKFLEADPPAKINEGGIVRRGFHMELDDLRSLREDAQSYLAKLENEERDRTGITNLKVRYNNVFGYFLEISKSHLAKVPADWDRRQTLANAERYVTPKLKELEYKILSARARQWELERELFVKLRANVADEAHRLQQTARVLAKLDVLCSFATSAIKYDYARPEFVSEPELRITGGRHPVVERVLAHGAFVPNDTYLNATNRRFAVLTGPNMGGKSTYLRQTGIIQILAQAGSFVPAKSARLNLVDRIFTRLGASDDLTRGDSTFMVEMREASLIMKRATERSLVLIDEIGRGTATTDGLAIATSIAEWLHDVIRCRTIFSTHFHELTELPTRLDGVFCLAVGVNEHDGGIELTHQVEERASDRSYGVEVAKLAGLPEPLVRRAEELLAGMEKRDLQSSHPKAERSGASRQFSQNAIEVIRELEEIQIEEMTPLNAMLALERLKRVSSRAN